VRSSAGTHTELNAVVLTAYELVKELTTYSKTTREPHTSFLPWSQLPQTRSSSQERSAGCYSTSLSLRAMSGAGIYIPAHQDRVKTITLSFFDFSW